MTTKRKPIHLRVSWFEVPTKTEADGSTTFLPGEECWENFPTLHMREARSLLRRLMKAQDLKETFRGKGIVASVYFTECY